ncbi:hypothetical protein ADZ36_15280 [Streptomyces fradiae]|uniref:Uncharacterized protein n=1 Tax=Streptomyces fradiae TaxID=1906 RepID=A0ACC4WAN6_STRFR|nr:hypothetical protein ADZ36_15280 [Streptomyces fradiae]
MPPPYGPGRCLPSYGRREPPPPYGCRRPSGRHRPVRPYGQGRLVPPSAHRRVPAAARRDLRSRRSLRLSARPVATRPPVPASPLCGRIPGPEARVR